MRPQQPGAGLWRLTLYNLLRKPGRSVAALLGVVLASATIFAGGLIGSGVSHALDLGLGRLGADLMVVPAGSLSSTHKALVVGEPVAFYMDGAVTEQVRAVPGVKAVSPQVYVETLASSACCTGRIFLVGFDPATDFTVQPWLDTKLGRTLTHDEILLGNHVLVLPGDTMKFYGSDFRVVDRLEPSGMGMDETVFLPAAAIPLMAAASVTKAEQPLVVKPGEISSVMVRVGDPDQAETVARAIEAKIPGVQALTAGAITRGVTRDLSGLMTWLLPVAGGALLVSILLFLVLFSAIAAERSREIGLLRALGATERQALASLVGEAAMLGTLGGAAGTGAGLALYAIFQNKILFSYVLPFAWPNLFVTVLLGLGVVIGSGLLAALAAALPARRIARLEPYYAIHAAGR
ncbi:MAG TPA: FtsX-like permease family protein [Symbiobacteriaceae bacterium]|nr:FtsX-like permease family protein [Symbiobacteriaceae bacterium]